MPAGVTNLIRLADRMAKWLDRIEEEHCGEGVTERTMRLASDAGAAYTKERRKQKARKSNRQKQP